MTLLESHVTPPFSWTEEHIVDLRRMWLEEEMSSGAIAAEFGVTRNTVIGKIGRLGLSGRVCDAENRSKGAAMREARNRLKAARLVERAARPPHAAAVGEVVPVVPAIAPCALLELDDSKCHWPFGEPQQPGFHFCGGKAVSGAYCAGHHSIAYRRIG